MLLRAASLLIFAASVAAQAADPQVVRLWPDRPVDAGTEQVVERGKDGVVDLGISEVIDPTLTVYLPEHGTAPGPAILICPGGGYGHLAIDKEGHDVGRWLASIGVVGVVLKYRLPFRDGQRLSAEERKVAYADRTGGVRYMAVAVEDAERSMKIIRERASEWHVRPDAVGLMGFSAGGHLAVMMATSGDAAVRPDFVMPIYPATPREIDFLGPAPQAFIAHANDDKTVSPDNSIRYYQATRDAGVSAELHIFESGGHGFGLDKAPGPVADWPNRLNAWMRARGYLAK
ncbi:MAG: alpha/beta hydrolase [Acidobacteria bacterium]|nr:alpha/beta hydrolase [Acidobacteriota bacterium]MDA1236391.1 alpha/beta hydrolase [Acidobacteriota bacterium]